MIVLCDLDGTLLRNSMASFQPAYLKALSTHLADRLPPDRMIRELLAGTQKMIANQDPTVTLEEAFDRHFYPNLNIDKQAIIDQILDFYLDIFPNLAPVSEQIPAAIAFVRKRLALNDQLIIATNPLFPRVATFTRLDWAGLSIHEHSFRLITTYEMMHFSKPHPEYYAEILAYLGYPEEPVIMIGNDYEEDIRAASKLCIPVYWLTEIEPISSDSHAQIDGGDYSGLDRYIRSLQQDNFNFNMLGLASSPYLLQGTLAALDTYTRILDQDPNSDRYNQLEALIHSKHVLEREALSRLSNRIVYDHPPSDSNPLKDVFRSFSTFRLNWLNSLNISAEITRTSSSENTLAGFIRDTIRADRELLSEITLWNLGCPNYNHTQA